MKINQKHESPRKAKLVDRVKNVAPTLEKQRSKLRDLRLRLWAITFALEDPMLSFRKSKPPVRQPSISTPYYQAETNETTLVLNINKLNREQWQALVLELTERIDFEKLKQLQNPDRAAAVVQESQELRFGSITVKEWNQKRKKETLKEGKPEFLLLSHRDFSGARIAGIDLSSFGNTIVDLRNSDFSGADLRDANLARAFIEGAKFDGANLSGANLTDLNGKASFKGAILDGANVSGVHPMKLVVDNQTSQKLLVFNDGDLTIQADGLIALHTLWLYATGERTREAMETLVSKRVPLLGRFAEGHLDFLHTLAEELKKEGLSPIIFEFKPLEKRNLIETIIALSSLSQFIIADLSAPRSVFQELQSFIPNHPNLLVIPIIERSEKPVATFESLLEHNGVSKPVVYSKKESAEIILHRIFLQLERTRAGLEEIKVIKQKYS